MFEKLVESNGSGADQKNRRRYFLTSSVIVGIVFLSAVVISIYAADFGLGKDGLELTEMIAPVDMAAAKAEPPKQRVQTSISRDQSTTPTRTVNMARVDEAAFVPTTTSAVRNTEVARPIGAFRYDAINSDPSGVSGDSGRGNNGTPGTGGPATGLTGSLPVAENDIPEPPPIVKAPPVEKKPVIQSLGVINGKATNLPTPPYPAAAKAVGAAGKVSVQVLIDETGKVVSANAVSGHPLLTDAAVRAARGATFSPTYLSKVPVKVTGVIVYNFNR